MPTMSTGFVRAAGYADKVRRVLFATAKGVEPQEIVRASAEFNMKVFEILQEKKVDKSDVVRIRCDYEIKDGKIEWKWDTLELEVYAREDKPLLSEAMKEVEEAREALKEIVTELSNLSSQLIDIAHRIDDLIQRVKREHIGEEEKTQEQQ
ncbi:MAG: single- stranded DNA-binding family protein [Candidatus Baldrarchaeia archaeon]